VLAVEQVYLALRIIWIINTTPTERGLAAWKSSSAMDRWSGCTGNARRRIGESWMRPLNTNDHRGENFDAFYTADYYAASIKNANRVSTAISTAGSRARTRSMRREG
jgi:hypothetical protein